MSLVKPDDNRGEINCPEKIEYSFVITCGNGAELFEFSEEILDQVA